MEGGFVAVLLGLVVFAAIRVAVRVLLWGGYWAVVRLRGCGLALF